MGFITNNVAVCDFGTGYVKCGFAGDNFPRNVFPNVVGRPNSKTLDELSTSKDIFIGEHCHSNKSFLEFSYPIRNGIVQNWDDMSVIMDHAFQQHLKINPADSKIMLTDSTLNTVSNRQKMLELVFEQYQFSAAYMQIQAVLALYAQGLMDGLVLDCGDGICHAVPVVSGNAFPHLIHRLPVAGRHVSSYLLELMLRRGYAFNKGADFEDVRKIKESICYVAQDYRREAQLSRETTHLMQSYTLPDGLSVRIGQERFMAPEVLFNPSLVDCEAPGLADMAFNCIQDVDIDNRMLMYRHVVLCGGSTMFPGLSTRLERDLRALYLEKVLQGDKSGMRKLKLKVEDPPNRKFVVFLGGAVLADLMKDRTDFWVTKEEFQEDPHRALKKCIG